MACIVIKTIINQTINVCIKPYIFIGIDIIDVRTEDIIIYTINQNILYMRCITFLFIKLKQKYRILPVKLLDCGRPVEIRI